MWTYIRSGNPVQVGVKCIIGVLPFFLFLFLSVGLDVLRKFMYIDDRDTCLAEYSILVCRRKIAHMEGVH